MADVRPLKAVRYNKKSNLSNLVTQPYDKISPELKEDYKTRDPHNLVNVLLPEEKEGKTKYQISGETFHQWIDNEILKRDDESAFYPYRQNFNIFGENHQRSGFIGLVKVEPYSKKIIFPHEKTLTGPKKDRMALLKEGRVHYGLIFLLYKDDGKAQKIIDEAMQGKIITEFNDDFNVENQLWQLTDKEKIHSLNNAMADKQLFIADGHHRYETSLAYAQENLNDISAQYTMAMFVNINSPLVVLPTHRVVRGIKNYTPADLSEKLKKYFDVSVVDGIDATITATKSSDEITIGVFDGEKYLVAKLKNENAMKESCGNYSEAWRSLDVAVLHTLIIEKCLGITQDKVAKESAVSYHRNPKGAVKLVKSGKANCAFFLKPTSPAQVCEVALNGEVMPQKSTDFYPKLLSGITMYSLD
ncbi:MAG: hypothetical protein DRI44_07450 [Chlamydiae bacterium]|nr:MAG: hypothetical protein DRI44_07450 [Chlamydiota bacterium]